MNAQPDGGRMQMDKTAVRELARQVVDYVAPDEVDEFDSQADAWFADPRRAGGSRSGGRGPLGFGLEDVVTTIVPSVLFIAQHILSATAEVTAEEGVRRVARWRGRGKAGESGDEPEESALDTLEIATAYDNDPDAIRRAVLAAGDECGADPDLIVKVADRILVLLEL